MWYLEPTSSSANEGSVQYFSVTPGDEVTIGRQKTNIKLHNATVSRNHATFSAPATPTVVPSLILTDVTSSCGSFVNGESIHKIPAGVRVKADDEVYFGDLVNKKGLGFTLRCIPLNVCFSTVPSGMKSKLEPCIKQLGGCIHPDIQLMTRFLVMPNITVTHKLVMALVHQVSIVTPDYFTHLQEAVSVNNPPPIPRFFIPAIGESQLSNDIDLSPNIARQHLFRGKAFYFLHESDLSSLGFVVTSCQGVVKRAFSKDVMEFNGITENMLVDAQSVVIQSYGRSRDQRTDWENHVYNLIRNAVRRVCYSLELSYAVLYASVASYCNPTRKCNFSFISGRSDSQAPHAQSMAFVPDTQSQTLSQSQASRRSSTKRIFSDINSADTCNLITTNTKHDHQFLEPALKRPCSSHEDSISVENRNRVSLEDPNMILVERTPDKEQLERPQRLSFSPSVKIIAESAPVVTPIAKPVQNHVESRTTGVSALNMNLSDEDDLFYSVNIDDISISKPGKRVKLSQVSSVKSNPVIEKELVQSNAELTERQPSPITHSSPSPKKRRYDLFPTSERKSPYPSPNKSGRPSDYTSATSPKLSVASVEATSPKKQAVNLSKMISKPKDKLLDNLDDGDWSKVASKSKGGTLVKLISDLVVSTKSSSSTTYSSLQRDASGNVIWNGQLVPNFKKFRPKNRGVDFISTCGSLKDNMSESSNPIIPEPRAEVEEFAPFVRPDPPEQDIMEMEAESQRLIQSQAVKELFHELAF